MINALENWREFALEIKWKRADHNNPFLIRINEACDEIERFFNPKDFEIDFFLLAHGEAVPVVVCY